MVDYSQRTRPRRLLLYIKDTTRPMQCSFSGESTPTQIPVYFSFKEQLITKIHEHVKPHLVQVAVQNVANTSHYLLKHRLNPPNRKALLFNVAMILLGHLDEQDDKTIILAYNVMEYINNAKQQMPRSNITNNRRTGDTRRTVKRVKPRKSNNT